MKDTTQQANDNGNEQIRFLIPGKSLTYQLRLRSDDRKEIKDLKYLLDVSMANECQAQTTVRSTRELLLSVRHVVDEYRQRLPLHTERLTADVFEELSGLSFDLRTKDRKPEEKHREDFKMIVKSDLNATDVFHHNIDRKCSKPGPSS